MKLESYLDEKMFVREALAYCSRHLCFQQVLANQIDDFCKGSRPLRNIPGKFVGLCIGELFTSTIAKEFLVGVRVGEFFICVGIISCDGIEMAKQIVDSPEYGARVRSAFSRAISLRSFAPWPLP